MIKELGKLLDDIEKLRECVAFAEKRVKGSYIYGNIITPMPGILIAIYGVINLGNDPDYLNYVIAGAATCVGMELIYQFGHFTFKFW